MEVQQPLIIAWIMVALLFFIFNRLTYRNFYRKMVEKKDEAIEELNIQFLKELMNFVSSEEVSEIIENIIYYHDVMGEEDKRAVSSYVDSKRKAIYDMIKRVTDPITQIEKLNSLSQKVKETSDIISALTITLVSMLVLTYLILTFFSTRDSVIFVPFLNGMNVIDTLYFFYSLIRLNRDVNSLEKILKVD
ncbi:MAG: hypothetical protein OWQ54_05930 [Sulfolobaceae archaeon]|nr:hypothetical protein [Sulfolobaceae archaeon]